MKRELKEKVGEIGSEGERLIMPAIFLTESLYIAEEGVVKFDFQRMYEILKRESFLSSSSVLQMADLPGVAFFLDDFPENLVVSSKVRVAYSSLFLAMSFHCSALYYWVIDWGMFLEALRVISSSFAAAVAVIRIQWDGCLGVTHPKPHFTSEQVPLKYVHTYMLVSGPREFLSEKAYKTLKRLKRSGESFSDAFSRLAGTEESRSLLLFTGTWVSPDLDEVFRYVADEMERSTSRKVTFGMFCLDTGILVALLKGDGKATALVERLEKKESRGRLLLPQHTS